MNKPRRILFPLICLLLVSSCQKIVDDKKKDLLLQIITSGEWNVEEYLEGSVNITSQFSGLHFQFTKEGNVIGHYENGNETGTWTGDIANYSITSNFPVSGDPVKKLNGTWKIIDSSMETVQAEMAGAAGKNILHLRKNP